MFGRATSDQKSVVGASVWGEPAEGSGETLQLHTCDCCDSSITLVWLHHGMGFMVKLNTSFLAENLDGLTLRTKFK